MINWSLLAVVFLVATLLVLIAAIAESLDDRNATLHWISTGVLFSCLVLCTANVPAC